MHAAAPVSRRGRLARLAVVTVLTGAGAGLGGMALAMLLHLIQHLAYGYSPTAIISEESFLQGVSAAPGLRRVLVLVVCGAVAGVGWWALYRWGRPLIGIRKAVAADDPRMPPLATVSHSVLQIVTVGLGSPLGREVAPREIGALVAGWLSHWAGLCTEDSRIMVACGAGAGLAAVYNVPLAGGLFVMEVLLRSFNRAALIPALATSVIAAMVAWLGLGNQTQYDLPRFSIDASLMAWAILAGPIFGYAAFWYGRLAAAARERAPHHWHRIVSCLLAFLAIGVAAIAYPQVLGNGRGPTQLGLSGDLTMGLAATLLVLKLAATTASVRAGAAGGMLTPGLAIGALLATILGQLWSQAFPGEPPGAFAIVGATAFLAASMSMPLTAIVLMMEFTHMDHDLLFPVVFAVAGSTAAARLAAGGA